MVHAKIRRKNMVSSGNQIDMELWWGFTGSMVKLAALISLYGYRNTKFGNHWTHKSSWIAIRSIKPSWATILNHESTWSFLVCSITKLKRESHNHIHLFKHTCCGSRSVSDGHLAVVTRFDTRVCLKFAGKEDGPNLGLDFNNCHVQNNPQISLCSSVPDISH